VQPVIDTVAPAPAEPRQALIVTGTGFGTVTAAFFVDVTGLGVNTVRASYIQVADGEHAIVTVPPGIVTDNDYYVELVTIEDEVSTNNFGNLHVQPISGVVPAPAPTPTPDPFPLPIPGVSAGLDRLRRETRLELADRPRTFQSTAVSDGVTTFFDLPPRHIEPTGLLVVSIAPGDPPDQAHPLVAGTDYILNSFEGQILLTAPLVAETTIYVTGTSYRFFDNDTLDILIERAFQQVTHGRRYTAATINQWGYRQYTDYEFTYDDLPEVEIAPTAILAQIQGLWLLATDSAYEIDIQADGASIPRTERYRQLMGHIAAELARFNEMAQMLNIGLNRIEMASLRRISRTTGRLVPLYLEKEYDDHRLPTRELPGVDHGVGEGQEFVDPYYQAGSDYGGGFGP
jgi:hypothetical protein